MAKIKRYDDEFKKSLVDLQRQRKKKKYIEKANYLKWLGNK